MRLAEAVSAGLAGGVCHGLATHVHGYVAHHGCVVGQPDVLCLVVVGRPPPAIEALGHWGRRVLLHNEGSLDIDLNAAGVYYGAIDLGRGGRCPGPPYLFGVGGRVEDRTPTSTCNCAPAYVPARDADGAPGPCSGCRPTVARVRQLGLPLCHVAGVSSGAKGGMSTTSQPAARR